jgi:hypothetical protein
VTAPDVFAEARAKLDSKIAQAARDMVALIESEVAKRGPKATIGGLALVSITVPADSLATLRAHVAAFEAFNDTLHAQVLRRFDYVGDGS